MRNFLSVITGIITSYVVILLIEIIQFIIYPPPPGFDPMNHDHFELYMKMNPIVSVVFIAVAHFVGTIIGGLTGLKIAKGNRIVGYIIGGIMLTLTVINLFMIEHPVWFMIVDVAAVIIAFFIFMKMIKPAKN